MHIRFRKWDDELQRRRLIRSHILVSDDYLLRPFACMYASSLTTKISLWLGQLLILWRRWPILSWSPFVGRHAPCFRLWQQGDSIPGQHKRSIY